MAQDGINTIMVIRICFGIFQKWHKRSIVNMIIVHLFAVKTFVKINYDLHTNITDFKTCKEMNIRFLFHLSLYIIFNLVVYKTLFFLDSIQVA
jgi:hypothetical protein